MCFVDLCATFQPAAVGNGPGPNFGRILAKKRQKQTSIFCVPNLWTVFCDLYSRFGRRAILGGSGAASSGHLRPILGGSRPELKMYIFNSFQKAATSYQLSLWRGASRDAHRPGDRVARVSRCAHRRGPSRDLFGIYLSSGQT